MTSAQRSLRPRTTAPRRRGLLIGIAVVVAFLAVVVVGQLTNPGAAEPAPAAATAAPGAASPAASSAATASPRAASAAEPFARRDPADPLAAGAVDAPVVLVQWTDMRCPFCASFHRDTMPLIDEEYVRTGRVRVELHVVAYFGEQSQDAAAAVHAAGRQGMAFAYLDAVYAAAPDRGHPDLPRERLLEFARVAGIPDLERFAADLDDPALRAAAQQDTTEAQRLGVGGVPFFVSGSSALSGAQPAEVFRQFLDDALARAA